MLGRRYCFSSELLIIYGILYLVTMHHFKPNPRFELQTSDRLGRHIIAAKDLKAGETILSDEPFVVGPNSDTSLVCFNCYLPLISKFVVCKKCAVTPMCPGGCPEELHIKWHTTEECDVFRCLKQTQGLHPMTMVQNVGSLLVLRALLKKKTNQQAWDEFMAMKTHLEDRKKTNVWQFCENAVEFINSLKLFGNDQDVDLVQKICAAIDINSFEVRGPLIPSMGCSEVLRAVYLKGALLAHDCTANTHMSINDNNLMVCRASVDIKKGDVIYYNYTDPLKGTAIRQQLLLSGKYFQCSCKRCSDVTENDTFLSSALCSECKTEYISKIGEEWKCHNCKKQFEQSVIGHTVQCCMDKFGVINKKDEKELEEYIRNVSMVLAPNHFLLLDAKQRLAGVLRDAINREPRPMKKLMRRKMELCQELLPVLEKLCPGISRTKAITLYELYSATVKLAKKLFDGREITGTVYMDELLLAEKYLKRSLEMLFIEPGNSPEGELCAKALEEYRALKANICIVLDAIHAEGKTYTIVENGNDIAVN